MLSLLALFACAPGTPQVYEDNPEEEAQLEDTGPSEEELDELYGASSLVVLQPLTGEFLPIEEPAAFVAELRDTEGQAMEFTDIQWSSSLDSAWGETAASFETEALEVGTHDFTATAHLPNGDRLTYAVGGVLVQSTYAGTYTGTLVVDLSAQGYQVACSGATTIYIDAWGQAVIGDANCLLSIQGFDLDGEYLVEVENSEGDLSGQVAVNLMGFEVPMEFEGALNEDGELIGTFYGDLFGYGEVMGELTAVRVSRSPEPL